MFFKNEAKTIIKEYLFWTDFLSQRFGSIDALNKEGSDVENTPFNVENSVYSQRGVRR